MALSWKSSARVRGNEFFASWTADAGVSARDSGDSGTVGKGPAADGVPSDSVLAWPAASPV